MKRFPKDPRPAETLLPFHMRVRRRTPWLQTALMLVLMPLLIMMARLRVRGKENIPDGGYLVVGNHPSNFDPLFVALAVGRRIRFMGKSELFNSRWGKFFTRLGGFPVRRGVWDTEAFKTAEEVLNRGRVVAMFLGGGVHEEEVPAKPGGGYLAHVTGATVLPVYLEGTRSMYKPWIWPKVRVTIGEPIKVEHDPAPTRERSQATAQQLFDRVYALKR